MPRFSIFPEIAEFLARLPRSTIVADIMRDCQMDQSEAEGLLDVYLNEVHVGYAVVKPYLSGGLRILEVGSGIGLLSAFLAHKGHRVSSLEPSGTGFDFFSAARRAVLAHVPTLPEEILEIPAEALNPSDHGSFNLIFSVHVLEHLDQLGEAFNAMATVLFKDGKMIHLCPNYAFPYDPHFGLPLVPFFPKLTEHFISNEIAASDVWRSLNFISVPQVRRLARSHGMHARFATGQLADMINRMQSDPVFAERHKGRAAQVLDWTQRLGMDRAARKLPALFDSPMLVELQFGR